MKKRPRFINRALYYDVVSNGKPIYSFNWEAYRTAVAVYMLPTRHYLHYSVRKDHMQVDDLPF